MGHVASLYGWLGTWPHNFKNNVEMWVFLVYINRLAIVLWFPIILYVQEIVCIPIFIGFSHIPRVAMEPSRVSNP